MKLHSPGIDSAFHTFAALVCSATATAKVLSVIMHPDLALTRDIVFQFLSVRSVLAAAALVEILTVAICLSRVSPDAKSRAVFWFSSMCVLYRVAPVLISGRISSHCRCLGDFAFAVSQRWLDLVLVSILALLFFGSLALCVRGGVSEAAEHVQRMAG